MASFFRVISSAKAPACASFSSSVAASRSASRLASSTTRHQLAAEFRAVASGLPNSIVAPMRPAASAAVACRAFSSQAAGVEAASKELLKTIQSEIQHEQSTMEKDPELEQFVEKCGWTLTESDNNMIVSLEKSVGGKKVVVEFSCVQNAEAPADEEGAAPEMADFTVTITNANQSGVVFYCSTTQDEEDKFRYCIGQVRLFNNAEEKESLNVYPGPYFEDLDDAFQQGLDEWLAKLGVDADLCDFIDRYSVDKENREYVGWLKKLSKFVEDKH